MRFRPFLKNYADTLREGDKSEFTSLLDRAAQARRALPAKWVPATEDLLEVRNSSYESSWHNC